MHSPDIALKKLPSEIWSSTISAWTNAAFDAQRVYISREVNSA